MRKIIMNFLLGMILLPIIIGILALPIFLSIKFSSIYWLFGYCVYFGLYLAIGGYLDKDEEV